jgi:hypothetical protein
VVVAGGGVAEVVAAATMVRFSDEVTVFGVLSASLTLTLKEDAPLAAGVPLIVPLVESANPAGKEPEARLHV